MTHLTLIYRGIRVNPSKSTKAIKPGSLIYRGVSYSN